MKDRSKGNGHKTETPDVSHIRNVEVEHERSDVSVKGVLMFVVILTISGIAIHLGVAGMYSYFSAQESKEPGPGPMALSPEERLPPEPRLQSAPGFEVGLESGQKVKLEKARPQAEYQVLRQQWEENLRTGLKDSSGKVVGMPIDEAIKKVASGGLPSKEPNRKLSEYAISVPTAASSGRETEKRLQ